MGSRLGLYLVQKRIDAKLSQAALARALGFSSPQFVSNMERGLAPIPKTKVSALSKLLKVTTDSLIDEIVEDKRLEYRKAIWG